MAGFSVGLRKAYEGSGKIASSGFFLNTRPLWDVLQFSGSNSPFTSTAIDSIRTVTSLGRQDQFLDDYDNALLFPLKKGNRNAWVCFLILTSLFSDLDVISFGFGFGFHWLVKWDWLRVRWDDDLFDLGIRFLLWNWARYWWKDRVQKYDERYGSITKESFN